MALAAPTIGTVTSKLNEITVSWNALTGATNYEMTFNGTIQATYSTSGTFSGLSAGTNYSFQLKARDSSNTLGAIASKTLTTLSSPPQI